MCHIQNVCKVFGNSLGGLGGKILEVIVLHSDNLSSNTKSGCYFA